MSVLTLELEMNGEWGTRGEERKAQKDLRNGMPLEPRELRV